MCGLNELNEKMGRPAASAANSTTEPLGKPAAGSFAESVEMTPNFPLATSVRASSARERRGAVAWCVWKATISGSSLLSETTLV